MEIEYEEDDYKETLFIDLYNYLYGSWNGILNKWRIGVDKLNKEQIEQIRNLLIKLSGIPFNTSKMRFNTYNSKIGDKQALISTMAMSDMDENGRYVYGTNYDLDKWNHPIILTLAGGYGTGKTHLAIAAGNEYIERYDGGDISIQDIVEIYSVIYRQVNTLMGEIKRGFSDKDTKDIIKSCKMCSLLILDDLGAENKSEWSWSVLDELIDYRYINEQKTIITTNLTPNKISGRIASRLCDKRISKVVSMKNGDYRLIDDK